MFVTQQNVEKIVHDIVNRTPVTDVHTHLYAPQFGELLLAGLDELLTYHYLIAESLCVSSLSYEEFWSMAKTEQAQFIWNTLFAENTPYSEATRGVVTVLQSLGVNLSRKDLNEYRQMQKRFTAKEYVDFVFQVAGVDHVVMTNDPFDDVERAIWLSDIAVDQRFYSALRLDPLLDDYPSNWVKLRDWGYDVSEEINERTVLGVRQFLRYWIGRMGALYVAVSLPDDFVLGADTRSALIEQTVLPLCQELGVPFALMIGVKRGLNPDLRSAGDGVGKADISVVEHLCRTYPRNKFLVTILSRENQHELTVVARKFRNLMIFGCWWFLNNPTLIEEITRMRFEMLGSRVIAQHSDARVLDQLIYKWAHSKQIIAKVLIEKYSDLLRSGWALERSDIERDVNKLFNENFWDFLRLKL